MAPQIGQNRPIDAYIDSESDNSSATCKAVIAIVKQVRE